MVTKDDLKDMSVKDMEELVSVINEEMKKRPVFTAVQVYMGDKSNDYVAKHNLKVIDTSYDKDKLLNHWMKKTFWDGAWAVVILPSNVKLVPVEDK